MLMVLALGFAQKAINTALATDELTQRMLADKLTGKSLQIKVQSPSIGVLVYFDADEHDLYDGGAARESKGKIRLEHIGNASMTHTGADCLLQCETLAQLLSLAAADSKQGNIPVQGDAKVLMGLQHIVANMQIDIGLLVRPFVGDAISLQIQNAVHKLKQTLGTGASVAKEQTKDWLEGDSNLVAKDWQVKQYKNQLRYVRTETDRLQAKVDALRNKLNL